MARPEVAITLVGAGKMGSAMLAGWLKRGIAPAGIHVMEAAPSPAVLALQREHGFRLAAPFVASDVLVLAVKPQSLADVAPSLHALAGAQTLVISIIAGKTIADLARALPCAGAFVRAMPNLPAAIGQGVTGAAEGLCVTAAQHALADKILSATGGVEWLADEALIDAVTALSGSGPAYVFLLVEAMAQAGAELGLPPATAMRLARATVEGAGALLRANPV